jgi:hypothetical protein
MCARYRLAELQVLASRPLGPRPRVGQRINVQRAQHVHQSRVPLQFHFPGEPRWDRSTKLPRMNLSDKELDRSRRAEV